MKRAACYIRVSTEEQTEYSPDAQLRLIKEYAKKHDMILDGEHIYIDEGISGRKTKNRRGFNQMIGRAKKDPKPFDVILLWKYSRFARNREDAIVYKSMLRRRDIEVISITESIGDDKMSVLVEAMIEAMDEYYSINLGEEVIRGMTQKALTGGMQTAPPLGYDKERDKDYFTINEEEAKIVEIIYEEYLKNNSILGIARKLNEMGAKTKRGKTFEARQVEYILNNPVYKGYLRWTPYKTVSKGIYDNPDTIIRKGKHEAIIEEEKWNEVKKKYDKEKAKHKKYEKPTEVKKHWLSGIVYCGNCGGKLTYNTKYNAFQCYRYSKGKCNRSCYISAKKIEEELLKELSNMLKTGKYITVKIKNGEKEKEREYKEKEKKRYETMLEKAKSAYLAGIDNIEEYGDNKRRIKDKIEELEQEIKESKKAKEEKKETVNLEKIIKLITSTAPKTEKQTALGSILEKITYTKTPENRLTMHFIAK